MGPSITHCTDRLNGLGDSTAGPVWENSLKPSQPLSGGYEGTTNYPVGDNLHSPVRYSAIGQSVLMKLNAKIVGPVCGYNLFNFSSYLFTAITMFAFIYYLTKSRWIALMAGYAVAYTPYIQSKIGGHPSYGFAGLLILALWLTIHIFKNPKYLYGVLLALIVAFSMSFDPYFVLLTATVLVPVVLVWFAYITARVIQGNETKENYLQIIKIFSVALLGVIILISPLIYVRLAKSAEIDKSTNNSRGNVLVTAQQCSNLPLDYLLPDPRNQLLAEKIKNYTQRNINLRHWCGFGESRVSVSLVAMTVIGMGLIIILWEVLNNRRTKLASKIEYKPPIILINSIILMGAVAMLAGMPPNVHGYTTLSGVILKLTATWRVFAREYIVINLATIVLFAIVLRFFSIAKFRYRRVLMPVGYVFIFMGILIEYQITTPFLPLTFSYKNDTPNIYKSLRLDSDVYAIAEYPVDRIGIEYDSTIYYLTMQKVHQKKIFNSASSNDIRENIHIAMKDLTDPQTIPALRATGVDHIIVHDVNIDDLKSKVPDLQIITQENPAIFGLTMVRPGKTNNMVLAKIKDGPKLQELLVINKGFTVNLPIQTNPLDVQFEILQDAELGVSPVISDKKSSAVGLRCFEAKMSAPEDRAMLAVLVNGQESQNTELNGKQYSSIQIIAKEGDVIRLRNSTGHNMRLNNLGCK